MEKNGTNNPVNFERFLEAILLNAACEVSLFIESLSLQNLKEDRRLGRVCLAINNMLDELSALNRYQYVYYYNYPASLFNLLKSTNRLEDQQELEILKRVIVRNELLKCLLALKMELETKQHVKDFFSSGQIECMKNPYLPGGTLATSTEENRLWLTKSMNLEEILTRITQQLIDRIGLLKDPSRIGQFVRWLQHPNRNVNEEKIYIDCRSNEFKCVMHHFKVFNRQLNCSVIGRYGIFISQNGIPITSGNMRNSSYKNLNTRLAIANIFAAYR
jgi:hypothetical protein